MRLKTDYLTFILLASLFILIFSIFGIHSIKEKAELPANLQSIDSNLVVKEIRSIDSPFSIGDTITSIDGIHFAIREEVEVYLDGLKQNSDVTIKYQKNGITKSIDCKLVPYFSNFYVVTACSTGLLLIFIGLFVLWKKPEDSSARLFNSATLTTASIVLMTWGNYSIPLTSVDYILHIIYSLSYSLAPAFFIHFTLIFPRKKNVPHYVISILYLSALTVSVFASIYFLRAINLRSINYIRDYLLVFNLSRIYNFTCIISAFVIFIHSYITSQSLLEKKKLRWILLGLFLGPLVFACLWVIPLAITDYGLISEELVVTLMLFIPITFAIAILKHHIFDIDLIIKRSVVYFSSFGLLIFVYALVISILTHLVKDVNEYLTAGVAAIIIAILFHPAKERIQKLIDKKFFRVNYNFRIASRKLLDELINSNDITTLGEKIINQIKFINSC